MLTIVLLALHVVAHPGQDTWNELVFDRAVVDCERNPRPSERQIGMMKEFYALEIDAGVSYEARGILLSALCNESAYVFIPKHGDGGKAVGVLQHWPRHARGIRRVQQEIYEEPPDGDPRLDALASAVYWLRHLKKQLPRVREHCKGKRGYASHEEMVWASANLTAVARPKCAKKRWSRRLGKVVCVRFVPHCARANRFETGHFRRLRRWHSDARERYTVGDATERKG